jgi:hydrogenase nickel incorporation protein HypA/HybF
MHEMTLAASLVELVEEQARANGLSRVDKVWLTLGALAGVQEDALSFGFEVACHGTCADGAALCVEHVAAVARCGQCATTTDLSTRTPACPSCGAERWELTGGRELRLTALEGA